MATTYTANARLQKPATSDRNWDVPINANADALDGMSAIGGLAVSPTETPSATLQVGISAGTFINSLGLPLAFAGTPSFAVPSSATTCLWLTASGTLTSGVTFPTTAHVRLAQVISGPSSLIQVIDARIQCAVAGTALGFVLKAGDAMSGPLTVASPTTGSPMFLADPVNRLVGFFGATPASQAPALTPLASSPAAIASDTLADVGGQFSQPVLNNNFASLAAKVDALIAALKRHGLMGS
jgi:hypothetical protein